MKTKVRSRRRFDSIAAPSSNGGRVPAPKTISEHEFWKKVTAQINALTGRNYRVDYICACGLGLKRDYQIAKDLQFAIIDVHKELRDTGMTVIRQPNQEANMIISDDEAQEYSRISEIMDKALCLIAEGKVKTDAFYNKLREKYSIKGIPSIRGKELSEI